ncbi:hypothetical protein MMC22_008844 [Lobaria immixta]|nr:hypothetical protein [Lobaria immixta]
MPSTGLGYQPVKRHSDYDLAAVGDEQTRSSSISTQKLSNGPAKPSAQAPQRLRVVQFFPFFIQILLTIFPVLFIALAATAVSLDKKPISRTGRAVQHAISLSPTIFPIAFAAIIGKFFRALGLFWAERGIKLGLLERLIGSQSLFAAIERQVYLRGQYLLGILMILLWALSPLGGQSALRLLQVSPRLASANATIRYLPIGASDLTAMKGASDATFRWPSYASIYMTALTASHIQRNSGQDLFGNVRIPSVDSLTRPLAIGDGSWTTVNYSQEIPYSSMLGIPVVGIPVTGNLSFNIVSRYLAIDCNTAIHVTNSTVFQNTSAGEGAGFWTYYRGGSFIIQRGGSPSPALANVTIASFNMTSINGPGPDDVSFVNCSMEPRDVESSIFCSDQSCQVTAMRNLTVDLSSWWSTDFPYISTSFIYLPLTTVGVVHHGSLMASSLTEMWLQDPNSSYVAEVFGKFANLSQLPLPTLSRNLEVLYNTYWQSTYEARYLFGNLSTDMSLYDNISGAIFGEPVIDFNISQVIITRSDGKKYACNMTFAALLMFISCLLFLAGMTSLVLLSMTLAPDILGYVSSYTRDNPFAALDQASYLDGLERARAMREMRVTLGDVNIGCETGHVAFAVTAGVQRLRKDRVYD